MWGWEPHRFGDCRFGDRSPAGLGIGAPQIRDCRFGDRGTGEPHGCGDRSPADVRTTDLVAEPCRYGGYRFWDRNSTDLGAADLGTGAPQIWGQNPADVGTGCFQPCVSHGRTTKLCPGCGFVPQAQPSHVSLCFRPDLPADLSSSAVHPGVPPLCPSGPSAAGEDGEEIPGSEGERKMWLQEILHRGV